LSAEIREWSAPDEPKLRPRRDIKDDRSTCRSPQDQFPSRRRIIVRRTLLVVALAGLAVGFASPALAANPPGPNGPPSQSCQKLEPNTPGHSALSPGSPFNEAGINSVNGGIGGQHYTEKSQYDVACFQVSQR